MGARKNVNVTGASENTAAVGGSGGTYTHAQFFSDAAGTVAIDNPFALDNQRVVDATGMFAIDDGDLYLTLGVQGSDATVGQLKNTELKAMLDARYPAGATTATVRFGTGATGGTTLVNPTAAHSIDAWDAAIDWV